MLLQIESSSSFADFFIEVVKSINGLETWVQVVGLGLTLLTFIAFVILWKTDFGKPAHRRFAIVMIMTILMMFGTTLLGAMVISARGNRAATQIQNQFREAGIAKELSQPLTITAALVQRGTDSPSLSNTEFENLASTSMLYSKAGVTGFENTTLSVARLAFREGRLDEARTLLEASLSTGASAEKLNDLGVIAYTEGMKSEQEGDRARNLEAATRYFEQALQQDSAFVPAVNNLGLIYLERKEFEKAIRQFDQALGLDPTYARALNNRGLAYRRLGQATEDEAVKQDLFTKAKADFEAALAQDSTIPEIHYNLALLEHLNLKETQSAVGHYRRVVEMDPGNITARNNLSILLQEDESPAYRDEALRLARQAVDLRKNDACLLDTLARAYLLTEDCANARETARQAVELLSQGIAHMRCDEQEIQELPAQIDSRCKP
jgi:tetratricopeptide (TPR) repeat protein